MKKLNLLFILPLAAIVSACQCSNDGQGDNDFEEQAAKAQYEKDIKVIEEGIDSLISATKDVKMAPFVTSTKDGRFTLTDAEKMVKPDYLLDPSIAGKAVTLSQKYHLVAMFAVDMAIASIYDMPMTDMKEAMAKMLLDLNDEAFTNFANTPFQDLEGASDALELLVEQEYEAGRQSYYWEAIAASMVEQLYIITRDVDKFMPMFTNENVFGITFNFVYLREGLMTLVSHNPEMSAVNNVLAPLYVINAMSVDEFRDELLLLKDDIEKSRAFLIK